MWSWGDTMNGSSTGFLLRRRSALVAAAASALPWAQARAEAPYPNRPIKLVLPSSPGSAIDGMARALAPALTAALKQPIVIENVAGSGGLIGTMQMLRAPKDGYTLGIASSTFAVSPSLYKMQFDPVKDVQPISVMTSGPMLLVAHPKLQVNTLRELLAVAKARPADSGVVYGSAGIGSTVHLAGAILALQANVPLLHVPYKGTGQYLTDLIGGQLDCGFLPVAQALPHLRSRALRPLGLSTTAGLANLPELKPLAEQGLPGFDVDGWVAVIAARGIPRPVVELVNKVTVAALRTPEMAQFIAEGGGSVIASSVKDADTMVSQEIERYAKVIKTLGIKAD